MKLSISINFHVFFNWIKNLKIHVLTLIKDWHTLISSPKQNLNHFLKFVFRLSIPPTNLIRILLFYFTGFSFRDTTSGKKNGDIKYRKKNVRTSSKWEVIFSTKAISSKFSLCINYLESVKIKYAILYLENINKGAFIYKNK